MGVIQELLSLQRLSVTLSQHVCFSKVYFKKFYFYKTNMAQILEL